MFTAMLTKYYVLYLFSLLFLKNYALKYYELCWLSLQELASIIRIIIIVKNVPNSNNIAFCCTFITLHCVYWEGLSYLALYWLHWHCNHCPKSKHTTTVHFLGNSIHFLRVFIPKLLAVNYANTIFFYLVINIHIMLVLATHLENKTSHIFRWKMSQLSTFPAH